MFKVTAIALVSFLSISAISALGFLFISINAFYIIFGIASGLQLFIGYPINKYLDAKERTLDTYSKLLTEQEQFMHTAQHTNIECAYCNTMNNVQVHINNDYRFKCRKCEEISKITVDTRSCRTTELEPQNNIEDMIDAE